MKKVAIVGFGFMGRTHYGAWKKCRGAKVVAVCDAVPANLSAKVKGNLDYVAGTFGRPQAISAAFHRNAKGAVDHTTATLLCGDALITSDSSFAPAW